MDISELREVYKQAKLAKNTVDPNPIVQFQQWFDEAMKAELLEPNAMVLTTVDTNSEPAQRTVLLKYFDAKGFVFFTNYKSSEIQSHPGKQIPFPFFFHGMESKDKLPLQEQQRKYLQWNQRSIF